MLMMTLLVLACGTEQAATLGQELVLTFSLSPGQEYVSLGFLSF